MGTIGVIYIISFFVSIPFYIKEQPHGHLSNYHIDMFWAHPINQGD